MRRARSTLGVLCLLAAAVGAPDVAASEVSSRELSELASAARDDAKALTRLRRVERVDARPAAIGAALRGARGRELDHRLRALAAPAAPPVEAPAARARARAIVGQRRFQPAAVPRPLRRPLEAATAALDRAIDWLAGRLPGGRATVWALLAVPVALGSFLVAARLARRAGRGGAERTLVRSGDRAQAPAQLEREADVAESRGELEHALRLRFRAGLLRLDRLGAISLRPSLTIGQVSRRLRSPSFDELRLAFEGIAYGGRRAAPAELDAARERWPRVLEEASR